MTHGKTTIIKILFRGFICCSLITLYLTGWLSRQPSFADATGWNQLSEELKPKSTTTSAATDPSIHWLGHAGFLITWHGKRLLFDPNLSSHCTIAPRLFAAPATGSDLPPIDAVIISHAHYDHLDNSTLEKIKNLKALITPKGTEDYVSPETLNRTTSIGLKKGESYQIGPLEIIAVHAEHNGGRNHPWTSNYFALGYIVRDKFQSIYYSGDTAFTKHFEEIGKFYKPTTSILPIGGFEPRFLLKYHHLNPEDAVLAGLALGEQTTVIPSHFATFRVALDTPTSALPRFAQAAKNAGLKWQMPELYQSK